MCPDNGSQNKPSLSMPPARPGRPSPKLFILMTLVYFGAYFGLKYGLFGGTLPWYYNLALILACLGLALTLRSRFGEKQGE